jgi:hypothetical protein
MTKITICKTDNGWIVVRGDPNCLFETVMEGMDVTSFNSLDKAMADIRKRIKAWHKEPAEPKTI